MTETRGKQLAYSELKSDMLDEQGRRTKATKIVRVLQHYLGRDRLDGLVVADVGCSTGFMSDLLRQHGASVVGIDIDAPGLARARDRFGGDILFICADGEQLPLPDGSVDLIIFNHIYEHTVDDDAVMRELRRIIKPTGAMYLGLGNKLGVIEPHYKLPFLSYLPRGLAHRYVRAFKRADTYHERFRTRAGLKRLVAGLQVWDYTFTVVAEPERFNATDMVPGPLRKVPVTVWRLGQQLVPTYIWIATPAGAQPSGRSTMVPPERVVG